MKNMAKKTSYQKLKSHNADLVRDIYDLVYGKDEMKKIEVKLKWSIQFQTEELIWSGDPTKIND